MNNNNPVDYITPNSLASIWSMMLPGLGQLLKGQIMPGLFWAFLTAGGYYSFFWPGIIIHSLCVLDAALNKGQKSWKQFVFIVPLLLIYIIYRNTY